MHRVEWGMKNERVCITPTAPANFRVYGTRKTVHGLAVVEVHTGFYLSPDLTYQAISISGDEPGVRGWVIRRSDYSADGGAVLRSRRDAIEALADAIAVGW